MSAKMYMEGKINYNYNYLVLRLRVSGVMPLLLLYAWIVGRGTTYLFLTFTYEFLHAKLFECSYFFNCLFIKYLQSDMVLLVFLFIPRFINI